MYQQTADISIPLVTFMTITDIVENLDIDLTSTDSAVQVIFNYFKTSCLSLTKKCTVDYYGTDCDKPYCFGAEDCKNGDCVRPDVCNCNPDYTGMKCLQPVCTKSCLNGGTCTKPDNALVEKTGPALTALSQHVYQ